jgi:hypothetical protein
MLAINHNLENDFLKMLSILLQLENESSKRSYLVFEALEKLVEMYRLDLDQTQIDIRPDII